MDAQVSDDFSVFKLKKLCAYQYCVTDFLGEVFGLEIGQHSRSSIGVNVLPLGVPVEIEAIFEIRDV